jgi:hypothetical protein
MWHAYALKLRRYFRSVKALKTCPSEDGFCNAETKHDGRMVPRPKLFVLVRRCQKQMSQTQELLGSSPSEYAFCTLEINNDRD